MPEDFRMPKGPNPDVVHTRAEKMVAKMTPMEQIQALGNLLRQKEEEARNLGMSEADVQRGAQIREEIKAINEKLSELGDR